MCCNAPAHVLTVTENTSAILITHFSGLGSFSFFLISMVLSSNVTSVILIFLVQFSLCCSFSSWFFVFLGLISFVSFVRFLILRVYPCRSLSLWLYPLLVTLYIVVKVVKAHQFWRANST